ncbi:30S ribosomal protein S6 [bacterium]|nr:30S ribosomal protein S6 [bacterium]
MRAYECLFILVPSLEETEISGHIDRFAEIITSRGGLINKKDIWGKRRLAYTIDKYVEGIYVLFKFSGNTEILDELRRVFRYDSVIIRHMIILDDGPSLSENEAKEESIERE